MCGKDCQRPITLDPKTVGRPIPEAADSVAALCRQAGDVLARLATDGLTITPCAKLFPNWTVDVQLRRPPNTMPKE